MTVVTHIDAEVSAARCRIGVWRRSDVILRRAARVLRRMAVWLRRTATVLAPNGYCACPERLLCLPRTAIGGRPDVTSRRLGCVAD